MTALALAFLAGLLTSLSPCVLPVLPLVVGSAMSQHRLGPLALCAGLSLSFSVLGALATLVTQAIGFDPLLVRSAGMDLKVAVTTGIASREFDRWPRSSRKPFCRRHARCRVEPVFWPNAWRGDRTRDASRHSPAGLRIDVGIRTGGQLAVARGGLRRTNCISCESQPVGAANDQNQTDFWRRSDAGVVGYSQRMG
jgi:hypothetical protein